MNKVNKKVAQQKDEKKNLKIIKSLYLMQKKAKLEDKISDLEKIINSKVLTIVIGTDSGAITGLDDLFEGLNLKTKAKDKLKNCNGQLSSLNKILNIKAKVKK